MQPLQRRAQPEHQHHLALRLPQQSASRAEGFLQRRHRLPAKLREQPDGVLNDKMIRREIVSGNTTNFAAGMCPASRNPKYDPNSLTGK